MNVIYDHSEKSESGYLEDFYLKPKYVPVLYICDKIFRKVTSFMFLFCSVRTLICKAYPPSLLCFLYLDG